MDVMNRGKTLSPTAEPEKQIYEELTSAMKPQQEVGKLIDLFVFGLFLVFIMYMFAI
jgi:hypothetical protein